MCSCSSMAWACAAAHLGQRRFSLQDLANRGQRQSEFAHGPYQVEPGDGVQVEQAVARRALLGSHDPLIGVEADGADRQHPFSSPLVHLPNVEMHSFHRALQACFSCISDLSTPAATSDRRVLDLSSDQP